MPATIQRVKYFYSTVHDRPGVAYEILAQLFDEGVKLLAFSAIPMGLDHAQLMLFPEDPDRFVQVAEETGLVLSAPHCAILMWSDDDMEELVEVHRKLADQSINVYASNGVNDGRGNFGYVLYVRQDRFEEAANVLGV